MTSPAPSERATLLNDALEALVELVRLGESGTGYVSAAWIEGHDDAKDVIARAKALPALPGQKGVG